MAEMRTWTKVNTALPNSPKIDAIARATGLDRAGVLGRVVWLWAYYDDHGADNHIPYTGRDWLESHPMVACEGFADAMQEVGWLDWYEGALILPQYEENYGHIAKKRAAERERKRAWRAKNAGSEKVSRKCPVKCPAQTRVEETRTEGEPPLTPPQAETGESASDDEIDKARSEAVNAGFPPEAVGAFLRWIEARRGSHPKLHPMSLRAAINRLRSNAGDDWPRVIDILDQAAVGRWKSIHITEAVGRTARPAAREPSAELLDSIVDD